MISGSYRGRRGGSFYASSGYGSLKASSRSASNDPSYEFFLLGFRIVEVPEPATLSLLALGGLAMMRRRRL